MQSCWRENNGNRLVVSRDLHKVVAYPPFYFQFHSWCFGRGGAVRVGIELSSGGRIGVVSG